MQNGVGKVERRDPWRWTDRSLTKWWDKKIIMLLERLSAERDLTSDEAQLLDLTIVRIKPPRSVWRWSEAEDRAISDLIARRPIRLRYAHYAKPFERNDDVRELAAKLGRSEWAIYRRMERLRKREELEAA